MGDFRIFTVRSDLREDPRGGDARDFFVIDCADWVNVCAVTPEKQLVMIEQFRHGSESIELEVPGGIMDPEDPDAISAGLRELSEETGYTGNSTQACVVGQMFPNAAIMSNRCYTLFLPDAVCTCAPDPDPSEDIRVRLIPLTEVPSLIAQGRIRHAIVLAALSHFMTSPYWKS